MKKRFSTKQLTTTALLLALCIIFQMLRDLSIYITGPVVNCILIIATLYCGLFSGTFIALAAPVFAFFISASKPMQLMPMMIPVIMLGNELIVLSVWIFRKKHIEIGMLMGSVTKFLFLWLTFGLVLLPIWGSKLPPLIYTTVKLTFSYPQLITACTGSILAWIIYKKGILKYANNGDC